MRVVLIAETTSLGITGLAAAEESIGLLPGVLVINGLYVLLWFNGLQVYRFTMRHPEARSFADLIQRAFGGRWSFWYGLVIQVAYLVFVVAAHIDGFSLMVSQIDDYNFHQIVWKSVGMGACLFLTIPRTLNGGKWIYLACKFYRLMCRTILSVTWLSKCCKPREPMNY